MKKKRVYILLFLIFFFIMFIPTLADINSSLPVINVKNEVINNIEPEYSFIGVNWADTGRAHKDIFLDNVSQEALINKLKSSNINFVRYPGGLNVVFSYWDIPNKDVKLAIKKLPNWEKGDLEINNNWQDNDIDFQSFMKFCKKADIKADIQVNVHSYFDKEKNEISLLKDYQRYPDGKRFENTGKVNWNLVKLAAKSAAEQVKWAKENGYSNNISYWEFGNEDYCQLFLNSGYTGDEYGKVAAIFLKEMSSIEPEIKVILTNFVAKRADIEELNTWTRQVLSTKELEPFKNNIYAFSNHIYGWGNTDKDTSYQGFKNNIYTNTKLDLQDRLNFHKSIIDESIYSEKKLFINEFNSGYFLNPYIHTWLGAIADAQMVLTCANNPTCAHMDFHELIMNKEDGICSNRGFGLFRYIKNFSTPFVIQPEGYVIGLLNENVKNNILKTSNSIKDVYVLSSSDEDNLRVIILNKGDSKTIKLNLTDFNNVRYAGNKSLGVDVPENFTALNAGESCLDPSEIRLLNVLDDSIKVIFQNGDYQIELPKNTLTVLIFKT